MLEHEHEDMTQLRRISKRMDETEAALYNHQTELSAFFMTSPFPMWLKGLDGKMLFVNNCYAKHYGITPDDYAGVSDKKFWGDKVAAEFYENDQKVITSGQAQKFCEFIKTKQYPNGIEIEVHKWPIRDGGGCIIAVAGMVTGTTNNDGL